MWLVALLMMLQTIEPPPPLGQGTVRSHFIESNWRSPLLIRLPVRGEWAPRIGEHVPKMIQERWADDLTARDLDHGHLLMKPDWKCPDSCTPGAVLDGVTAILYHTAENAERWSGEAEKGVPVDERRPRSVIGWSDGRVQPAVELVWEQRYELWGYVDYGTVFGHALALHLPDRFSDMDELEVTVEMDEGTLTCSLSTQIQLVQDSRGRMQLDDDRPYDAFLECFDPRGNLGP